MTEWQEKIDNIMDNFDFSRVAKTMAALGWDWYGLADIPTEPEIRAQARKMLGETIRAGRGQSTGGFVTKIYLAEKWVQLSFVVESWNTADTE